MKTRLTKEQSQHLIDLGVAKEKASQEDWTSYSPVGIGFCYPIFTLTDLLEILPKEIVTQEHKVFNLTMECILGSCGSDDTLWFASYERKVEPINWFSSGELIDALYQLACWYYGEYLKSEKK